MAISAARGSVHKDDDGYGVTREEDRERHSIMTEYLDPHFIRALCRDPERRTLQVSLSSSICLVVVPRRKKLHAVLMCMLGLVKASASCVILSARVSVCVCDGRKRGSEWGACVRVGIRLWVCVEAADERLFFCGCWVDIFGKSAGENILGEVGYGCTGL